MVDGPGIDSRTHTSPLPWTSCCALSSTSSPAAAPERAAPAHDHHRSRIADNRRQVLQRRIRWIVTATIAHNLIEAVVAIAAGTVASSAALIGFGLDSTIEVLSAAAVAWQFTRRDPERWEKGTLRVIAVAFSPSPRTSPSRPCSLSSTKWTSSTPLSVSSSPPSASSSCRSSRSRSVAPVASWDRPRPDTPYRRRGRRTGRGL